MSEPLIPWLAKQNIPISTDLAFWLKILASIFGFALLSLVSWALWGSRHRDLPGSTAIQRLVNDDTKIPEPQAVFVAIDQLKALFGEGRQMETYFQVPERPNPTINAVLDWIGRVNTCARQKDLKGLIGPKDLKKFNEPWDPKDVCRIESLLEQFGFFNGVDDLGRLAFRKIWGHVKRLEELLATIEGPATEVPAEKPPLLPKLAIHIALDGFEELIGAGEEMKRRLRENDEPLPMEEEIKTWGDQLIELAGSCATPVERNKLRNSLREIRVGDMFEDCLPAPQTSWPRIEEVFGKLKVARSIHARLLKEDKI